MDWHRLFGLLLTDFFTGSPFEVELEQDLSLKQQFLDVIVVRKRKGRFRERLPDGLTDLAEHNLITFKSHQETLDDWALKELTGHYVNYRKQQSPGDQPLLPEAQFRLYAVCSRYPHNLAQEAVWESLQSGVYRCRRGSDDIRVVVTGQLPQSVQNAPLHLFSASTEQVGYGAKQYRRRSPQTSTVLFQLFEGYEIEGIAMPYTLEDFQRDFLRKHLQELTPEERLEGLPAEERLKGLPTEERLKGLPAEEIERYLAQLKAAQPADSRKRRRKK